MDVEYQRLYGIEFRVKGVRGLYGDGRFGKAMAIAAFLRTLSVLWFMPRGMRPHVEVSKDFGDVWLEWSGEGERRVYIEFMLCGEGCEYDAEGVLEMVGFDSKTFRSLLNAFLKEARLRSLQATAPQGVG
ncbi:hypothetical protein ASQ66_gp02 [Aeropyrum pernix spindle-shaped virus 1]|uniref:Uncharacterized protein n=1 Tax=Aeropyrum pernix (strain ATCC 700893 / DSM 11879 / JCM 9820 / NBRC 100138 / K1) TaxID=272557 RepID=Q9YDU8_AERPE|nr:hypothetical protein [Aeropyrum pernix]YP_009177732.1 hypothetical protein ASQ66_gp02 [Aeropyrum pernix spindle-shaped virus 1]BAA79799.2 hypothetical protein APE_0820.1 [Aeropyrum pernix spindle-shaped virus 1] [Aeropyrum pernix K1]CCD22090.1 TPA: hypothetical protein [Aeropyrum pernix spindle-shaped virus 1]